MYCDWVLSPLLSSSQIHLDLPPHTITFIPSFCSLPSHCPSSPFLFLSLLISRHLLQLVLLEYSQELVLPWSVVNLPEVTLMKKADFLFQKLSNASSTSVEDDVMFPPYRLGFRLTWDRSDCCHNYSGLTTAVFCCLKKKKPLFLEFICSYNHSGHVHEQFQSIERNTEATHTFKLSDKITF